MHGRRSIIRRRDDDDITMTRPLNKRVSFSANNHTRLFQVDSDESTRQTNLDSTGQSSMSLMEHTMSQTLAVRGFDSSSSTGMMETTRVEDSPDDGEEGGFDWMDDNMEVDLDLPAQQKQPEKPKDRSEKQQPQTTVPVEHPVANPAPIDGEDKTRPVELRKERTDSVKDEILKVASKLLKPSRCSDETKSALDIYGIQAALHSQTGRREKPEHPEELDFSATPDVPLCVNFDGVLDTTNAMDKPASFLSSRLDTTLEPSRPSLPPYMESTLASCEAEGALENSATPLYGETGKFDDDDMLGEEPSLEDSQRPGSQEITRAQSESWFDVTGVNNLDQDDELNVKFPERILSPESGSNQSGFSKDSNHHSETENIDEEADCNESRSSNRLANSRDSMLAPHAKEVVEERTALGSDDSSQGSTFADANAAKSSSPRRSTWVDLKSDISESIEERVRASPNPRNLQRRLSPCLEVSSELGSTRSERRTFDILPADSSSVPVTQKTFDVLPEECSSALAPRRTFDVPADDCSSVPSTRRTFDVVPADFDSVPATRRTFDAISANETYSMHHSSQTKDHSEDEASGLADEVEPSPNHLDDTLCSLHQSTRAIHPANETPNADSSLDEWIEYDPDLFSVFAEPLVEHAPIPTVEDARGKQIIAVDEEKLRKALILDVNVELETFLESQRKVMRDVLEESRCILTRLEAEFHLETTVLIDNRPFYRAFSPEKFKIATDRQSRTAAVSYRVNFLPCMTVECREREDGLVACTATAVELPVPVCAFSSYVGTWVKNAFGGRSSFNAKTWTEAQSKVFSALKVIDSCFDAFESVKHRLHWCDEKQQVYLNMTWRNRFIRAYVDANLQEELVPQDTATDLSFRSNDLHAAWKSDGTLDYRERMNKVHRRNLEIAAEEMLKSTGS